MSMWDDLDAIIKREVEYQESCYDEEEMEELPEINKDKYIKVKQELNRYFHGNETIPLSMLSEVARRCILMWEEEQTMYKQDRNY